MKEIGHYVEGNFFERGENSLELIRNTYEGEDESRLREICNLILKYMGEEKQSRGKAYWGGNFFDLGHNLYPEIRILFHPSLEFKDLYPPIRRLVEEGKISIQNEGRIYFLLEEAEDKK